MKYLVNEVFTSIQGEGLFVGKAANFIRFTKCNLKCSWCDTNFSPGKEISSAQILKSLNKKVNWVSLTGGEPMLEEGLYDLIQLLKKRGYKTYLETNGSLYDKKIFDACDFISMDLKPPSTGNSTYSMDALNYCLKKQKKSQLKIVVADKRDLAFFRRIHKTKNKTRFDNWVIQPETKSLKKIDYSAIIKEFPGVRVIPQIHKFIEVR